MDHTEKFGIATLIWRDCQEASPALSDPPPDGSHVHYKHAYRLSNYSSGRGIPVLVFIAVH
jgi:hypothetical protein